MKCADCRYANKSGNPDYVFCTYWQQQANKYQGTEEEFVRNVMFQHPYPQKVSLGWGYPNQHLQVETHWSVKGTASEGLMYNGCICVPKEDKCHEFNN